MNNPFSRRQVLLGTSVLTIATFLNSTSVFAKEMTNIKAPIAKKIPTTIKQLGRVRHDDYAWMRDEHWQDVLNDPKTLTPEIKQHIDAENAYTKAMFLDKTADLRTKLFEEMKGRIKEDDSLPPTKDGKFAYYRKYREGGQFPIIMRQSLADNGVVLGEKAIIDGDKEAKGLPFWKLNNWQQNKAQDIIAYAVDYEGARNCDIRFRNPETGDDLDYKIEDTTGEVVFAKDNRTVFYVKNDENVRPIKVMRHKIGDDPAKDILVYEEKDHAYFLGIGESSAGDYIFLISSASDNNEVRYLPLDNPTASPKLIAARKAGFEYHPDQAGEYFYFRTNKDKAIDYKIMRAPITNPEIVEWEDFIPYNTGTLIEDFGLYKNYLIRQEMYDALPRIVVFDLSTNKEHSIDFSEEAYDLNISGGFEFDTEITRFSYSSPTTPAQVFDYNMATRERKLLKTQEIPSGHNAQDYVVKRIFADSTDGAKVPVTLLYKKTTKIDGSAPLYLYGYGSYGISMPDGFNTNVLNLVNRGFITAIAHIRGGMERGYNWYLDGKLRNKQHTFSDFINSAEALIAAGYTKKGKIVAHGGSAGGLLMGVVVNQRPDLWAGIVAQVAFVDMMNTISDETLPLTPPEWTEWGDPIRNKDDYDTMAAYSPYDNVATRAYPPIYAQTALSDSQVTYWEPTKWIAKLRDTSPNAGPFLLDVNMEAGHGGAPGRFDRLHEIARYQAFMLWALEKK